MTKKKKKIRREKKRQKHREYNSFYGLRIKSWPNSSFGLYYIGLERISSFVYTPSFKGSEYPLIGKILHDKYDIYLWSFTLISFIPDYLTITGILIYLIKYLIHNTTNRMCQQFILIRIQNHICIMSGYIFRAGVLIATKSEFVILF